MFDPTFPQDSTPATAVAMRWQLNALKALIDALAAQLAALANLVPVGAVIPWFKDTPGVPPLPSNFLECNGQENTDGDSPLYGTFLPDINVGAQKFVRGGLTSGVSGGIENFATMQADYAGVGVPQNFVTTDYSPGAVPIPPFVSAVYVMRIK